LLETGQERRAYGFVLAGNVAIIGIPGPSTLGECSSSPRARVTEISLGS